MQPAETGSGYEREMLRIDPTLLEKWQEHERLEKDRVDRELTAWAGQLREWIDAEQPGPEMIAKILGMDSRGRCRDCLAGKGMVTELLIAVSTAFHSTRPNHERFRDIPEWPRIATALRRKYGVVKVTLEEWHAAVDELKARYKERFYALSRAEAVELIAEAGRERKPAQPPAPADEPPAPKDHDADKGELIYSLLPGKCLTVKQFAKEAHTSEGNVRRCIAPYLHDRRIKNIARIGYYRPDEPPPNLKELLTRSQQRKTPKRRR